MSEVPLIIDNGSGFIKGGRANMSEPEKVVPALIGVKKFKKQLESIYTDPNFKFGEDVKAFASVVRPQHMNTNGKISDYSHLKKLLDKIMYTCSYDLSETPVLITDNYGNDKASRMDLISFLFEKYEIPALFIPHASTLSLYSTEKTTGVVVDIGDSSLKIVPVYEGHTVDLNAINVPIGGRIIDENLIRLMSEDGFDLNTPKQKFAVQDIKEKHCFIPLNPENPRYFKFNGYSYEDMSGDKRSIYRQLYKAPEVLFDPTMHYSTYEYQGVHQYLYESIKKLDLAFRDEMLQNIILTGGSSKFPGFVVRLAKELRLLLNDSDVKYKISMHENPSNSAWLGGVAMAGFPNFLDYFITREQFNDSGPGIVNRSYF